MSAQRDEALQFFDSIVGDLDTINPVRWSFLLTGATMHQVEPLMRDAYALGITEVEPQFDEEREGLFVLWLSEICEHTSDSFTARVAIIQGLADRSGLELADYSAGRPDDGAQ